MTEFTKKRANQTHTGCPKESGPPPSLNNWELGFFLTSRAHKPVIERPGSGKVEGVQAQNPNFKKHNGKAVLTLSGFVLAQVFVANPNKPEPIRQILHMNKERLLKFLSDFLVEKGVARLFLCRALGHKTSSGVSSLGFLVS